jgi:hypothetical protein
LCFFFVCLFFRSSICFDFKKKLKRKLITKQQTNDNKPPMASQCDACCEVTAADCDECVEETNTNVVETESDAIDSAKPSKSARKAARRTAMKSMRTVQPLSKQAAHLLKCLGYELTSNSSVLRAEPSFSQGLVSNDEHTRILCVAQPLLPEDVAHHVRAKYRISQGTHAWTIESKVVFSSDDGTQLSLDNLDAISYIAVRFAPPFSTVHLQADTHGAGNVFVGMIMSVNIAGTGLQATEICIPVNLVSGDIGCGLSVVPLVCAEPGKEGALSFFQQTAAHLGDAQNLRDYCSFVVATTRKTLLRGKAAEQGAYMASNLHEAASFYGFAELSLWLDDVREVLETVGTPFASYERSELDKTQVFAQGTGRDRAAAAAAIPLVAGLTYEQSIVLRYISRFAQSLGSSGNHFLELSKDDGDKLWLVVHTGSRGLGAAIYNVIAEACRFLEGGFEVATGALAVFYQRAFDVLCKFAKLNRVLCALAVLRELGFETNACNLQNVMVESSLFKGAVDRFSSMSASTVAEAGATRAATLALLGGLVHNGVSCFVNDAMRTVLFVVKKGAIAMTRRSAASIVALRAGDGCLLWTLADPTCATYETPLAEGVSKIRDEGFTQVYDSPDVLFAGHGAGRARPTSQTAKMSTFKTVVAFHDAQGMVGNISPGLLGDNPECAYNDVHVVKQSLPLSEACTMSQLKTLVAFKEGICYMPRDNEACAAYIRETWRTSTPAEKLTLDLNLVQRILGESVYVDMAAERDQILRDFCARFRHPCVL